MSEADESTPLTMDDGKPRLTFAESKATQESNPFLKMIISLAMVAVYYVASVLIFHNLEGWSVVDCIYFATVTFTTVGYGVKMSLLSLGNTYLSVS